MAEIDQRGLMGEDLAEAEAALHALLQVLRQRGYQFVTPTPATHARVLARTPGREAADLRDLLGWSLPFRPDGLEPCIWDLLKRAGGIERLAGGLCKSRYRVSSLDEDLFLHSAYPTQAEDAVFFGPDSYRFAALIQRELADIAVRPGGSLVDIGAGAGVGGIVAKRLHPELRATMTDINPQALWLAKINARAAGVIAAFVEGPDLACLGEIDLALANPPYIIDDGERDYRDGGGLHGGQVALEMSEQTLERLAPGGRLILYTGSAIIAGQDRLHEALQELADDARCTLRYAELDPDVFGEELAEEAYRDVERIALVAAVMVRG